MDSRLNNQPGVVYSSYSQPCSMRQNQTLQYSILQYVLHTHFTQGNQKDYAVKSFKKLRFFFLFKFYFSSGNCNGDETDDSKTATGTISFDEDFFVNSWIIFEESEASTTPSVEGLYIPQTTPLPGYGRTVSQVPLTQGTSTPSPVTPGAGYGVPSEVVNPVFDICPENITSLCNALLHASFSKVYIINLIIMITIIIIILFSAIQQQSLKATQKCVRRIFVLNLIMKMYSARLQTSMLNTAWRKESVQSTEAP